MTTGARSKVLKLSKPVRPYAGRRKCDSTCECRGGKPCGRHGGVARGGGEGPKKPAAGGARCPGDRGGAAGACGAERVPWPRGAGTRRVRRADWIDGGQGYGEMAGCTGAGLAGAAIS